MYEYAIKTKWNTEETIRLMESCWREILDNKKYDGTEQLPEALIRCTVLHGYDGYGNDGFSFCDPIAPVGWHETMQVSPLWDEQGNPYIYVSCSITDELSEVFFKITKRLLEQNGVGYTIEELED